MNKFSLVRDWKSILVGVVVIAAILRIYAISSVPVSLYWDETAIGYNAYSLAHTGKDEFGNFLPLLFRSFDDYKLPGYIYVSAVFVKLFGLSAFSVRIGSALLGTLSVFVTFFLIKELLLQENIVHKRFHFLQTHMTQVALWTAGLLAISPWHLQFSRTGFEANGALCCIVVGMYFLLRGFRSNRFLLFGSGILALSFYFYRSAVVFVPLLITCFVLIYWKKLFSMQRVYSISALCLFVFLSLPIFMQIFSSHGQVRFSQVTISQDVQNKRIQQADEIQSLGNSLSSRIIYNRRVMILEEFTTNYFSHFSPTFLFLSGDGNGRHHVVGMGQLYFWEILFALAGLYIVFFLPWRMRLIIFAWLLLSPLPAAITTPAPHALRSLNMLPIPQLLISLGIMYAYTHLQQTKKLIYSFSLTVVIVLSFVQYLHAYYVLTPPKTADDWGDGYKQLTSYIIPRASEYNTIIVTGHYWQPYIYFLFYTKYGPAFFQKNGSAIKFDKYYFGGTGWDLAKGRKELDSEDLYTISQHKRTLVAVSPQEFAVQGKYLTNVHTIYNTFGKEMFLVGDLR